MSKYLISAVGFNFSTEEVTVNERGELLFETTSKDGTYKLHVKTTDYIIQERIGDGPKTAGLSIVSALPPTK